mgnify:CR=1 FL=1
MGSRHCLISQAYTSELIDQLGYHLYGKWRPLPILARVCLKALLGLFHHASHELQRPICLHLVSKATYDEYCLNIYDPEENWVPWYKRDPLPDHPGEPSDETKLQDAIMMIFDEDPLDYETNPILQSIN